MSNFSVGNRLLPGAHAVNPVWICLWATLATSERSSGGGYPTNQFRRIAGQAIAIDLDLAFIADKDCPQAGSLSLGQRQLQQGAAGITSR